MEPPAEPEAAGGPTSLRPTLGRSVGGSLHMDRLSPAEFQRIQEMALYTTKSLSDVRRQFGAGAAKFSGYSLDGIIDYDGFKALIHYFFEVDDVDQRLMENFFLTFVRKPLLEAAPAEPAPPGRKQQSSRQGSLSDRIIDKIPMLRKQDSHSSRHSGPSGKEDTPEVLTTAGAPPSSNNNDSAKNDSARRRVPSASGPLAVLTRTSSVASEPESLSQFPPGSHDGSRDEAEEHFAGNSSTNGPARVSALDVQGIAVAIKDVMCYLSMLEAGSPQDKLEFMFHLYDADQNGYLDRHEIDHIIRQMVAVANYLGWDITELRPILKDMMQDMDLNGDGLVSLSEWCQGGLTTIPLLVLLGVDTTHVRDDGVHVWRLKHFNRPAFCNICMQMMLGLYKQGLCCVFCRYTVHERCVQRAPSNCITTYVKSVRSSPVLPHMWVEGKCVKCKRAVKSFQSLNGMRCRWCKIIAHNRCVPLIPAECDLGSLREHILPPTAICPAVLDRSTRPSPAVQLSSAQNKSVEKSPTGPIPAALPSTSCQLSPTDHRHASGASHGHASGPLPASSASFNSLSMAQQVSQFQVTPPPDTRPLLVFVNPKSGGKQGAKLMRKFQYLLNPRQVHDLIADKGPTLGLQFFKDVPDFRILLCGGDGTVGWLLDAMSKVEMRCQSPPTAILPLGTGNDLARCLGWGGGYHGESLVKLLHKIARAEVVSLDRWSIDFSPPESADMERGDPIPYNIVNNYFTIGVDAAIAQKFHQMRERHPEKFNSRIKNKMCEQFSSSCRNLHENIDIMVDGTALDLRTGGVTLEGIALLNIPSIHAGTDLWNSNASRRERKKKSHSSRVAFDSESSDFNHNQNASTGSTGSERAVVDRDELTVVQQAIGDGRIEILGLESSLHAAAVKTGFRSMGRRLAQGSHVIIRTRKRMPMQIDGEPWLQPPCTIEVRHLAQCKMLDAHKVNEMNKKRGLRASNFLNSIVQLFGSRRSSSTTGTNTSLGSELAGPTGIVPEESSFVAEEVLQDLNS